MTSKEHQIYEGELEYDDILRVSEGLLYAFNDDQWRSLPNEDGDYLVEIPQDRNELDRKNQIEKSIQCLRETADSIDKTHKYCTIATIAANSGSATASILSILGLTLAGGSLMLSAAGMGLGTMAGITGVSTAVSKHVINSKELERAERLITKSQKSLKKCIHPHRTDFQTECPVNNGVAKKNIEQFVSSVTSQVPKMYITAKRTQNNVKALKIVQANPALKALAKQAAATGSTSRKTISDVRKVFSGTPLAMTKGARILDAASLGLFFLFGAYSIGQDTKHLKEGAKAETAAEIREKINELEEGLHNLNRLYEELKEVF